MKSQKLIPPHSSSLPLSPLPPLLPLDLLCDTCDRYVFANGMDGVSSVKKGHTISDFLLHSKGVAVLKKTKKKRKKETKKTKIK